MLFHRGTSVPSVFRNRPQPVASQPATVERERRRRATCRRWEGISCRCCVVGWQRAPRRYMGLTLSPAGDGHPTRGRGRRCVRVWAWECGPWQNGCRSDRMSASLVGTVHGGPCGNDFFPAAACILGVRRIPNFVSGECRNLVSASVPVIGDQVDGTVPSPHSRRVRALV